MTREELIAALERADGPDAALDEAIYVHLGYWYDEAEGEWCERDSPRAAEGAGVPPYTSSIDAALTLVPEGHDAIIHTAGGADVWRPIAAVHDANMTYAATPAIALCISALKVRAP